MSRKIDIFEKSTTTADASRALPSWTQSLEHDPTLAEGLRHIREQYADLLPAELPGGEDEAAS